MVAANQANTRDWIRYTRQEVFLRRGFPPMDERVLVCFLLPDPSNGLICGETKMAGSPRVFLAFMC